MEMNDPENENKEEAGVEAVEAETGAEAAVQDSGKKKIFITIAAVCFAALVAYIVFFFVFTGPALYMRKGNKLFKEKRYKEAASLYDMVLQGNPRKAEALMNLGMILDSVGEPDKAVELINKAIAIRPRSEKAWNYKGNALSSKGDFEEALRCYNEAIRIKPGYSGAWANKAFILRKLNRFDESRAAFDKYLKLAAKNLKFEITPAMVKEITEKIKPLVQEAAGMSFKADPVFRIITPEELGEIEKNRILAQLKNSAPGIDIGQLELQAKSFSEFYSEIIPEIYDFPSRELLIVPDIFQRDMIFLKPKKEKIRNLLVMLLAHDLAHALDDQNYGISKRLAAMKDPDSSGVLESILEGHAVFIARAVAKKLGLKDDDFTAGIRLSAGDLGEASPFDEGARQMVNTRFKQIFVRGEEFIKYVHDKEGNAGINRLFSNPPARPAVIMQPNLYYEKELLAKQDYIDIISSVEAQLGLGSDWKKQSAAINEMAVRSNLSTGLAPKEVDDVLRGFNEGFAVTYIKGNSAIISLAVFAFRERGDAGAFFDAEERSMKSKNDRLKANPGISVKISPGKKIAAPPAGKAVMTEVEMASQNQRTYTMTAVSSYENYICEATFINCMVKEEKVSSIISEIFSKMKAKLNK